MSDIESWAREYRDRGFALARIKPGEKRPTDVGWTRRGYPAEKFGEADSIGLQSGRLSGDLVCVDIDSREALAKADQFLPPTGMVEGRPGKPRSHRWYRVVNIPEELVAEPHVAGGIGGPRTKQFKHAESKAMVVEFRGTGSQAVAPPSMWVSQDGRLTERREWHEFGEPAVVDCRLLFESVCGLARACGWVQRGKTEKKGVVTPNAQEVSPAILPIPRGRVIQHARSYLKTMDPAIQGKGGDVQTFKAACVLVVGFDLSPEQALPLLTEFNRRCSPPWTLPELRHKLEEANKQERVRGGLVQSRTRSVVFSPAAPGPLYLGEECEHEGLSYISAKSLWSFLDGKEQLCPELEELAWEGKEVVLAPPSTITTNKRLIWGEFFLARLLRQRGASVTSLRLPHAKGRKQTLAQFLAKHDLVELAEFVVEPPAEAWQAAASAEEAGRLAQELDAYRKALPRNKPSPKLVKALEFIKVRGIQKLTKDIVMEAKGMELSKDTLQRAMKEYLYSNNPFHTTNIVLYTPLFPPGAVSDSTTCPAA